MSPDTGAGVSVIVATRDRPELLRRALDSILDQDHDGPVEVIVVFDRSEPDRSLERRDAHRTVRVIENDHSPGLPGARNSGIATAKHRWTAFCDDDDEWLPGKLTAQLESLHANGGALMSATGVFIHFRGEDTARIPDPAAVDHPGFLRDRMTEVHPSSFLTDTAFLRDELGGIDEDIPGGYAEDYDLLLRATALTKLAIVERPLVRVHWHGGSFFFERWQMIDTALDYLVRKHPDFADEPSGLARIKGQQAVARAAQGQRRRTLRTIGEVLRLDWRERRTLVALAGVLGLSPNRVLTFLHRYGRGI